MPIGTPLPLSPIDPLVEKVTITFNFAPWLALGEIITSVVSVTATNATQSYTQDPNPQGIILGNPSIGPSPLPPNQASSAVMQQVSNCQPNVTYLLQCLVDTSGGQQFNLAAHLPCVQLN